MCDVWRAGLVLMLLPLLLQCVLGCGSDDTRDNPRGWQLGETAPTTAPPAEDEDDVEDVEQVFYGIYAARRELAFNGGSFDYDYNPPRLKAGRFYPMRASATCGALSRCGGAFDAIVARAEEVWEVEPSPFLHGGDMLMAYDESLFYELAVDRAWIQAEDDVFVYAEVSGVKRVLPDGTITLDLRAWKTDPCATAAAACGCVMPKLGDMCIGSGGAYHPLTLPPWDDAQPSPLVQNSNVREEPLSTPEEGALLYGDWQLQVEGQAPESDEIDAVRALGTYDAMRADYYFGHSLQLRVFAPQDVMPIDAITLTSSGREVRGALSASPLSWSSLSDTDTARPGAPWTLKMSWYVEREGQAGPAHVWGYVPMRF